MLKNLSTKLTEKFPVTTLLQMLSQKCLDWKQAHLSWQQKIREGEKGRAKKL